MGAISSIRLLRALKNPASGSTLILANAHIVFEASWPLKVPAICCPRLFRALISPGSAYRPGSVSAPIVVSAHKMFDTCCEVPLSATSSHRLPRASTIVASEFHSSFANAHNVFVTCCELNPAACVSARLLRARNVSASGSTPIVASAHDVSDTSRGAYSYATSFARLVIALTSPSSTTPILAIAQHVFVTSFALNVSASSSARLQ
mmetsp:Transcript_57984/g.118657  ORF Transcript_57984/g.118657 Transcript_57984/m.118657 type:complete len:206 (-) Transcript_57984:717-1334(-)